jgi:hypothetical protein
MPTARAAAGDLAGQSLAKPLRKPAKPERQAAIASAVGSSASIKT